MKKLISILLVLVLALGLMATAALAADVDVTDGSAKKGETVKVEIKATGVSAFSSCLASLEYDKAVLELTALDAKGFALDGFNVNNVESKDDLAGYTDGQPMVAWNIDTAMIAYATGSSTSADGVLFTATFKVLDSAEAEKTTVKAVVSMADADGKDVLKDVEGSGDITVETSMAAPGDVDGDGFVDDWDASLILQFFVGLIVEGDYGTDFSVGDVDGDGFVDDWDASLVLQYFVGLITSFD